jgi:hypothetical protein
LPQCCRKKFRLEKKSHPSCEHYRLTIMLLTVLALVAFVPFALVGFLYREAHIDMRQALLSAAATLAAVAVLAGVFGAL